MTISVDLSDAGKRLDAFLHERLAQWSRSRLQSWIKDGLVTLNGEPSRSSHVLHGGETVVVTPAELPPLRAEAEKLPLTILYEDNDVIVVDKQAGMVVHAGAGHDRGTLVNALLHHFGSLSSINGELRPGIVHRLDKETSGVIAVARTDAAHQSLAKQFHDREVEKTYLALIHGHLRQRQGRITTPITRDPVRRTRMTTRLQTGRTALTEYRVLEEIGAFSFVEVNLGTGRTHQIRVHLSSLGHPIIGDRLYGAPPALPDFVTEDRFLLHAHRLSFHSPSKGTAVTVQSPLPEDFTNVLAFLRAGADRMEAHR